MQKLLVRTALAVVGVLALAACTGGSGSSGQTLDAAAFADLADSPGVVVLDVRTPEEFASGHIPDAVNIDVSASDFASRVGALDADTSYAVYCRTGNRSATAMQIMQDRALEGPALPARGLRLPGRDRHDPPGADRRRLPDQGPVRAVPQEAGQEDGLHRRPAQAPRLRLTLPPSERTKP